MANPKKKLEALAELFESERTYIKDLHMWKTLLRKILDLGKLHLKTSFHVLESITQVVQRLETTSLELFNLLVEENNRVLGIESWEPQDDCMNLMPFPSDLKTKLDSTLEYYTSFEHLLINYKNYVKYTQYLPQVEYEFEMLIEIDENVTKIIDEFLEYNNLKDLGLRNYLYRPTGKMLRYSNLMKAILKHEVVDERRTRYDSLIVKLRSISTELDSEFKKRTELFETFNLSNRFVYGNVDKRYSLGLVYKRTKLLKKGKLIVKLNPFVPSSYKLVFVFNRIILFCLTNDKIYGNLVIDDEPLFLSKQFILKEFAEYIIDEDLVNLFPLFLIQKEDRKVKVLYFTDEGTRDVYFNIIDEAIQKIKSELHPGIRVKPVETFSSGLRCMCYGENQPGSFLTSTLTADEHHLSSRETAEESRSEGAGYEEPKTSKEDIEIEKRTVSCEIQEPETSTAHTNQNKGKNKVSDRNEKEQKQGDISKLDTNKEQKISKEKANELNNEEQILSKKEQRISNKEEHIDTTKDNKVKELLKVFDEYNKRELAKEEETNKNERKSAPELMNSMKNNKENVIKKRSESENVDKNVSEIEDVIKNSETDAKSNNQQISKEEQHTHFIHEYAKSEPTTFKELRNRTKENTRGKENEEQTASTEQNFSSKSSSYVSDSGTQNVLNFSDFGREEPYKNFIYSPSSCKIQEIFTPAVDKLNKNALALDEEPSSHLETNRGFCANLCGGNAIPLNTTTIANKISRERFRNNQQLRFYSTHTGVFCTYEGQTRKLCDYTPTKLYYDPEYELLVMLYGDLIHLGKFHCQTTAFEDVPLNTTASDFFFGKNVDTAYLAIVSNEDFAISVIHLLSIKYENENVNIEVLRKLYVGFSIFNIFFLKGRIIISCRDFEIIEIDTLKTQELLEVYDSTLSLLLESKDYFHARAILKLEKNAFLLCFNGGGYLINKEGLYKEENVNYDWEMNGEQFRLYRKYIIVLGKHYLSVFHLETGKMMMCEYMPGMRMVEGSEEPLVYNRTTLFQIEFDEERAVHERTGSLCLNTSCVDADQSSTFYRDLLNLSVATFSSQSCLSGFTNWESDSVTESLLKSVGVANKENSSSEWKSHTCEYLPLVDSQKNEKLNRRTGRLQNIRRNTRRVKRRKDKLVSLKDLDWIGLYAKMKID